MTLTAPRAGVITAMRAAAFKRGDELAVFDCDLERAELEELRLQHRAAKLAHELKTRAVAAGEAPPEEAELEALNAEIALARLNNMRKALGACSVQAPFDGRVVRAAAARGQAVAALAPLLTIASDEAPRFETRAPAAWLSWLDEGAPVELRVNGKLYRGTLVEIAAEVDPFEQKALLRIEIAGADAPPRPGLAGVAKFKRP